MRLNAALFRTMNYDDILFVELIGELRFLTNFERRAWQWALKRPSSAQGKILLGQSTTA